MSRVLVVDDDPVVRIALENLLAAVDWQVTSVADVTTALLALLPDGHGRYDAAVLDHDLPDGSGTEVAQALTVLHPGAHVVMHTSQDLPRVPAGVTTLVPKRRGPLAVLDHLQAHRPTARALPAERPADLPDGQPAAGPPVQRRPALPARA